MRTPSEQGTQPLFGHLAQFNDIGLGERRPSFGNQMINPTQIGIGPAFFIESADAPEPLHGEGKLRIDLRPRSPIKVSWLRYAGSFPGGLVMILFGFTNVLEPVTDRLISGISLPFIIFLAFLFPFRFSVLH